MKLLFITEFFPNQKLQFSGGVEARTYYIVQELKKRHNVQVISRKPVAVAATITSLVARLGFICSAIVQGLKAPADVIEGSNFVSYIPAFIVGKIKRIPTIAWYPDVFIGEWMEKFGAVGWVGEIVERITLKLPWDHIIALSKQTKQKLINAGVPEINITVIYAGVSQTEIQAIKTAKTKHPTICCISRLISYKRVADLLEAFAQVIKKIPQAQLVIIGTGPQKTFLHQLAKNLRIDTAISWRQNVTRSNLVSTLKSAYLFCLPSLTEGFGLVTLEAMAAGVPYINANIPINKEVTHGGKGGLLFEPKNPTDLAANICKLLINNDLYESKIEEGKQIIKNYSWEKSARETEAIYQKEMNKSIKD